MKSEISKGDLSNPYIATLHDYLANEYMAVGKFDEAEIVLRIAKDSNSKATHLAQLMLAQCYLLTDKIISAEKEIELLLDTSSVETSYIERALIIQAEIFVRKNDLDEALKSCNKALSINPIGAHNYINCAALLEKINPLKAIEYLNFALNLNEFLSEPIIYKKGEEPNIFKHQTSFLSSTKTVYEHLEQCYLNLNELDKAKEYRDIMENIKNSLMTGAYQYNI